MKYQIPKHTAGPWNVSNVAYWQVDAGHERAVVRCYSKKAGADARLIAAAPDLLHACKEALKTLEMLGFDGDANYYLQKAIVKSQTIGNL